MEEEKRIGKVKFLCLLFFFPSSHWIVSGGTQQRISPEISLKRKKLREKERERMRRQSIAGNLGKTG